MWTIPPAIFDGHLPLHKGGFAAYHQHLRRGTRGRDECAHRRCPAPAKGCGPNRFCDQAGVLQEGFASGPVLYEKVVHVKLILHPCRLCGKNPHALLLLEPYHQQTSGDFSLASHGIHDSVRNISYYIGAFWRGGKNSLCNWRFLTFIHAETGGKALQENNERCIMIID